MKSALSIALVNLFLGCFLFVLMMVPPKVSYASSANVKGPLKAANNGGGSYTYCCGNTSDYSCSQDVEACGGALHFLEQGY